MGLFSRKQKAPADANPYAQTQDSYANPPSYQPAQANLPNHGGSSGLPTNPRLASVASDNPPPSYKSSSIKSSGNRYGDEKYGNQQGYGLNQYDDHAATSTANRRGPGGYGGLDEDAGRESLLGSAAGRYVPPQQGSRIASPAIRPNPGQYTSDPNKSKLMGHAQDRYSPHLEAKSQQENADDEYGGYGAPRELTEEEREERNIANTKDEIKNKLQDGVQSTERALAESNRALELAAGSLARMQQQDERLANTERNLNSAVVLSRVGGEKTKELETVNRSMFAIHIGNPLNSKKRLEAADNAVLEQHRLDRDIRQATSKDAHMAAQNAERMLKDIDSTTSTRRLGAQRSLVNDKLNFDDESDDDFDGLTFEDDDGEQAQALRNQNNNLKKLEANLTVLNKCAHGMYNLSTQSIQKVDRLAKTSDAVDDHVRINREKLSRIR